MVNVRPFQLSDYAQVTDVMRNALSELCFTETLDAFGRQLSWDSSLVLVAEVEENSPVMDRSTYSYDGRIIGLAIGTIDHDVGYHYRIAVDPQHRRRGVARKLIHSMQQRFEQRKVKRILIPLDQHNALALPVFESLGFGAQQFTKAWKKLSIVAKR
jgi:ribosomal protein S18 acetylase RimI-like enzyme